MRILKTLTAWQFWASLVLMVLLVYGLYHFTFRVWMAAYTNHNEEIAIPDLSKMNIKEAIKTLDELGLKYEIDSVRHDSTRPIYSIIEFYPKAGFKVKEGRKIFIKSNPRSWQPVALPDIIGKSKRLAFTQLKISGLVVGDTIYEPDIAKDAVLRVLYKGRPIVKGTEIPRFAKVDLVLGKGLQYGVSMPNLLGMTLDEARTTIMANQFEVGRLTIHGAVTDSANLKVYYQYPIKGDNYDQGLPVDIWLTEKPLSELHAIIKDLDRQYRNVVENDSTAINVYKEKLGNRVEEKPETNSNTQKIPTKPEVKQPEGVEFD